MKKFLPFLPLVIIILLAIALGGKLLKEKELREVINLPVQSPVIGQKLPNFSLDSIIGNTKLDSKEFKGRRVLINVFGSWCVACLAEHPFMMKLLKKGIIDIYGINWNDSREDAAGWLKRHGNPYKKVGMDKTGEVVVGLGVTGAPETFLVDNGVIIYRYPAPLNEEVFNDEILPLIKR